MRSGAGDFIAAFEHRSQKFPHRMVGCSFAIGFVLDRCVRQTENHHFRSGQVDIVARRIAIEHLDRNPCLRIGGDFIHDSGKLPELLAFKRLCRKVVAIGSIRPLHAFYG